WSDVVHRVFDGIGRHVDARDRDLRHLEAEIVQEEALRASDVEHAVTGVDAVVTGERVRERAPAPVIAIAAVAELPIAVEVLAVEALGDLGRAGLVVLDHARQVVATRRTVDVADEVDVRHARYRVPSRSTT